MTDIVEPPSITPPVFAYDRLVAIVDIHPFGPEDLIDPCRVSCLYGVCYSNGPDPCGGCCNCLSGCQVEWENFHCAPFLWEGDYA